MYHLLGICLVIFSALVNESSGQLIFKKGAPHVKTTHAFYIGLVKSSRGEKPYYAFEGLRYAKPPQRFKPPEPLDPLKEWPEVIRAMKPGPKCPQPGHDGTVSGDEDCLYLNVYVPMRESPTKDGFPVMVWLHGGGFIHGSGGEFQPDYFMDQDVILVTINYRLGALGFLSTGDGFVPGNMGLKDMALALKLLNEDIRSFGGDKKRLSIFGSSAGAASVHFLMLSPMARGLFHNAIAQSGTAELFWALEHKPRKNLIEMAKRLSCPTESSEELVECLESKTVDEIINTQNSLKEWHIDPVVSFGPVVEIADSLTPKFLPDYPENIMERNEGSRVPLLLGFNDNEGLTFHSALLQTNEKLRTDLDKNFETITPITLHFQNWFAVEDHHSISKDIRQFYFKDKGINEDSYQNLTNMYTDAYFMRGVWNLALDYAPVKTVYPYVLTFVDEKNSRSFANLVSGSDKKFGGVAHGDELQYLFKTAEFPGFPKGSKAEEFSKRLVKLWASFAQHRKPTETWGSASKWPSLSKAQLNGDKPIKWYKLGEDTEILEDIFIERRIFWDKLLKKYYKKKSATNKDEL